MSNINPAYPEFGVPTTESVRNNFAAAANESDANLAAALAAQLAANAAQATANAAVRRNGDTMTGLLVLSGDATAPLGAVTKRVVDAVSAAQDNYLPLVGGQLVGPLVVSATSFPQIRISAAASNWRVLRFDTNNLARFGLGVDNVAEGGANAGSNLGLSSYNDAGTVLRNNLFTVNRNSGLATFNFGLTVAGTVTITNQLISNGGASIRLGMDFNNAVVGSNTDLTRGLNFFQGTYGIGLSSGRLNVISGGTLALMAGSVDVLTMNSAAITAVVPLGLPGDPTLANHASNKNYVDSTRPLQANTLPLMNGTAAIGTTLRWALADHVHASDTSRITQAQGDARYLQLSGGQMLGALQVLPPVGLSDAVSKEYVDVHVGELTNFRGIWSVAANDPPIVPPPAGVGDGDYWIASTADPNVAEKPPADLPGLPGQIYDNGDYVFWATDINGFEYLRGSPLNKQEADELYVELTGDTMRGPLLLPAAMPTGTTQATHKSYVDSRTPITVDAPNNAWSYGRHGAAWAIVPSYQSVAGTAAYDLNDVQPTSFQGIIQISNQAGQSGVNWPAGNLDQTAAVLHTWNSNAGWQAQLMMGGRQRDPVLMPALWYRSVSDGWTTWHRLLSDRGGTVTGPLTLTATTTHNGASEFNSGVQFGAVAVAVATDLSRHIALFGATFGFSITSNRLNVVTGAAGAIYFNSGTDVAFVNTAGITLLQGQLTLAADPTAPLHASNKRYTDTKLPLVGGTLSGGLTITYPTGSANRLTIDGPAGQWRALAFSTGGLARFSFGIDNSAETGTGNTGGNFYIGRFNDNGSSIANNFLINRNTGLVTVSAGLNVSAGTFWTTGPARHDAGLTFGSVQAPAGPSDLSRHLAIYGPNFGFSVTSARLNYNTANASDSHIFLTGAADRVRINDAGLNVIAGNLQTTSGNVVVGTSGINNALTIVPAGTPAGNVSFNMSGTGAIVLGANVITSGTIQSQSGSIASGVVNGAAAGFTLQAAVGVVKAITINAGGFARWQFGANGSAEADGDVGSDFFVNRYSSTGANLGEVLHISRASGLAIVHGDPVSDLGIATKGYVDARASGSNFLPISGGTITGSLVVNGNITGVGGVWSSGAFTLNSSGAYWVSDATYTFFNFDSGSWRLQYERATGWLGYVRGSDGHPLFSINPSGSCYAAASLASPYIASDGDIRAANNVYANNTVNGNHVSSNGTIGAASSIFSYNGRIVSQGGYEPTLCVYDTGRAAAYGWWGHNQGGALAFGWCYGDGTPGGQWGYLNEASVGHQSAAVSYTCSGGANAVMWGTWDNFNVPHNAWKPGGGLWADGSDARIKTVHGDYTQGLDAILKLRPVRYRLRGNWRTLDEAPRTIHGIVSPHLRPAQEAREFIGLVAQDVEGVMPEMVTRISAILDGEEVDDLRMMDRSALLLALVNAVKELATRVQTLESRTLH